MNDKKDIFENGTEADRLYGAAYREGEGHCAPTNPENRFDEAPASVKSLTPEVEATANLESASEMPSRAAPADNDTVEVFDHPVVDYINTLLPNGAPEGSRHKFALKIATDIIILCDGDIDKVRRVLLSLPWVQDVVKERGQDEIERILQTAQKRMQKREAENYNDPQPSKDMRNAIKLVTGRSYQQLAREARLTAEGRELAAAEYGLVEMLEHMGQDIKKMFKQYILIQLLCHRLPLQLFPAALFVGGAYAMTLCTRMWYRFWASPGKRCRMNCLLELLGRMGSGKQLLVDLYRLMMEPIKKSDAAQEKALNRWNMEREQKSGADKNKSPRPTGVYRCLPCASSAAAIREAEFNAKEVIDGEEWPLHVSIMDSELDNTLRQMKKGYMDIYTLWLKLFHNEPQGSFLKTSSSRVGEYDVHLNCMYSGTEYALNKQVNVENYPTGLPTRITPVPTGDTDFKMKEKYDYDEKDQKREAELREWSYKLNATKGEIPSKELSDALYDWTARRMADAKENGSHAEEDLLKRVGWVAMNFSLPFIVTRHWDKMVEEGGMYKCGPDFKIDRTDINLALLIANAQWAFTQHFFKAIAEQYYDNDAANKAANKQHQQKTLLAYRRLPEYFTSEDVMREYGYESVGSVCGRLKILVDDGMASKKIRTGEHKGKYHKLV